MVRHFRELRIYQQAFRVAQEIYRHSKGWAVEERFSLTDQIRRASRSVTANIAEAWRKRRYEKHFISKLSDADAEAAETQCWLDHALACGYLSAETHTQLNQEYENIIGGIVKMMTSPEQWCGPAQHIREEAEPYFTHTPILPTS